MEPSDCPRIEFGLQKGVLSYRRVIWYERPAGEDSHFSGPSHFVFGNWQPVRSIGLDDEVPEVVMDRVIEMMAVDIQDSGR